MKVLIGGGSGFIGNHLRQVLSRNGHTFKLVSRKAADDAITWDDVQYNGLPDGTDAVVNLSGNNLMQLTRFDDTFKERLLSSRAHTNQALTEAIKNAKTPPKVFIAASGVGYYPPSETEEYTEDSAGGSDSSFMCRLSRQVEESAKLPNNCPTRSVITRIGIALGRDGGAIFQMFFPFYFGLGGRIGSGKQWFPWIHVDDVAGFMLHAMNNEQVKGVYNLTAPDYINNAQFTQAFASALWRPAVFPVPEFALNLIYGPERACTLTSGSKVIPKRTIESGYQYLYPDIKSSAKEFSHLVAENIEYRD